MTQRSLRAGPKRAKRRCDINNKKGRSTAVFSIRAHPWPLYQLKAYARTYNYSQVTAFELAISCLVSDLPKHLRDKWLREFKRAKRKGERDGT